ncbi:MAG: hypothetical protein R3F56_12465 [Planctomycetota bacterium]
MLRLAAVAAALAPFLPAQDLTWFEGTVPTSLALRSVPESNPSTSPRTVLTDVELLPLEMTGRTLQQELDPEHSRRLVRHGLTRIELPHGGRVLAYRRAAAQTYGYLQVDAGGRAIVLLEAPASGGLSPFEPALGVSPDGLWAAATSRDGNSLFVMRLDGGTFASTGTPTRILSVPAGIEVDSVMPGRTHVFFASGDERVQRCAMADGGQLEDVGPPPVAGARVKSEMARSGDGSCVVYLYGVQPSFTLWMAGETGPARQLAAPPAKYEEPNYLPVFPTGPKMLLNEDGTRLMYTDATSRDEIYLLDTTGATTTTQVTADHNFEPYIGIGIFPTFASATLVLGVGDPNRFDVVAATTNDLPVVNLTMTGPSPVRPFQPGALDPETLSLTPSGAILIADHPIGGAMRLLAHDPASQTTQVLGDQLLGLPRAGDGLGVRPDVLIDSALGGRIVDGASAQVLLAAPAGVGVRSDVALSPTFRVLDVTAGSLSALVFMTAAGAVALPPTTQPQQVSVSNRGGLLLDGASLLYVHPLGGPSTLQTSGSVRVLVSGRGV